MFVKLHFFSLITLCFVIFAANAADTCFYTGDRKVFIGSKNNDKLTRTAKELITYLDKIDTAKWSVSDEKYNNNGIYLGLTDASVISGTDKAKLKSMKLEGYLIKPEAKSIKIIGNTELAVQHAAFDLLERLGCRFLTPAEAWTVIPQATGLKIASGKKFVQPDYIGRRIWYANGLGVGHSPDGSLRKINETYKKFFRSTRQGAAAPMGFGHSYYSTFLRHKKTFEAHPEWAGMKKDGTRPALNTLRGKKSNRNWCYSNPELAELCLKDRISLLTKMRKKNPHAILVSMDTNDGARACCCEKCKKLGNASDQALYIANYVARGIRKVYPNALVGILIYPPHILPPKNVKIEPNILPSMAMAFNRTGMSYAELVNGWLKAGAKQVSIYDYLGVYEWDYGMPAQGHVTYNYIRKSIPLFLKKWKALSFDAQSQASWGRYGPSMYLARKLLWDVAADPEKIYSEYFSTAFGEAAPEMRKLFDYWDTPAGGKLSDINIAHWLEMFKKALAKTKKSSSQVKRRMEDMQTYLHSVVLYHEARKAQALPKAERDKAVKKAVFKMLDFIWRTRERQMLQFWGFMTRMGTFGKEIHTLVWRKWVPGEIRKGKAEWMSSNNDYSSREVNDIFQDDLKKYDNFLKEQVIYSNYLTPLFPGKKAASNKSRGYFSGPSRWYFYVEKASMVKIIFGNSSAKGNYWLKAVVKDAKGNTVFSYIPELYGIPDKKMKKIKLNLKSGLYQLSLEDAKKRYYPVFEPALKNIYEQSDNSSTFNQYFTPGYIYVPQKLKYLKIRNSLLLTIKAPDWSKAKVYKQGSFSIPVGKNGGKVWEIKHVTRSEFILLNAPPYVSNRKENLLVPKELLK